MEIEAISLSQHASRGFSFQRIANNGIFLGIFLGNVNDVIGEQIHFNSGVCKYECARWLLLHSLFTVQMNVNKPTAIIDIAIKEIAYLVLSWTHIKMGGANENIGDTLHIISGDERQLFM